MLVLSRKAGQAVTIKLDERVGKLSAAELFASGAIEIVVKEVQGNRVRLAISADERLVIIRDELSARWHGPRIYREDEEEVCQESEAS